MKLLRNNLPAIESSYDIREELKEIKHSTCHVEIKINRGVGYQRSKIAAKIKNEEQAGIGSNSQKYISKNVIFTTYAPAVFEDFRTSLGISKDTYISVSIYNKYQMMLYCVILL